MSNNQPMFTRPEQTMIDALEKALIYTRDMDAEPQAKAQIETTFRWARQQIRNLQNTYNQAELGLLYQKMQRLFRLVDDVYLDYQQHYQNLSTHHQRNPQTAGVSFFQETLQTDADKQDMTLFLHRLQQETTLANEINDQLIALFNGTQPRKQIQYPRFGQLETILAEAINHAADILEGGNLTRLDTQLVKLHKALKPYITHKTKTQNHAKAKKETSKKIHHQVGKKTVAELKSALIEMKNGLDIEFPPSRKTGYDSLILPLREAINAIEPRVAQAKYVDELPETLRTTLADSVMAICEVLTGTEDASQSTEDGHTDESEKTYDEFGIYKIFLQMEAEFVENIIKFYTESDKIIQLMKKFMPLTGLATAPFPQRRNREDSSSDESSSDDNSDEPTDSEDAPLAVGRAYR